MVPPSASVCRVTGLAARGSGGFVQGLGVSGRISYLSLKNKVLKRRTL